MARRVVSAEDALSNLGDRTSLSDALIKNMSKSIGDRAFLLGEQEAPTDITRLISTGSTILDTVITNGKWPQGGVPVRRLVELTGNTSAGKSLVANQVLINTQKAGGIPILFDEENSTDISLLVKMGLKVGKEADKANVHKLVYVSAGTVEKVFDTIESTIKKIRELGNKDFITIVWDSIASTPSTEELEGSFDKEGYGTAKALAISKAMRKITQFIGREDVLLLFTNQLRANIGFGFGDKWTAPGGNAVPFHSSVRIRLTKLSDIKKDDAVIGVTVQAQTKKNKIAPPQRKCTFDIYFDKGIDDESSWMENLILRGKIARPTKQKYTIQLPEDLSEAKFEEVKFEEGKSFPEVEFKKADWRKLISDPNVREYVRQMVISSNSIDYSNCTPTFDELEVPPAEETALETGDVS
jgi:recombination protein RecA